MRTGILATMGWGMIIFRGKKITLIRYDKYVE
jgi:hypothetical protein